MKELKLTIPLVPPSVNSYVRHSKGRHYVTAEAKAYKEAIAIIGGGQSISSPRYEVEIAVWLGKGQRLDVDNAGKCPLDGLVSAGVIRSDADVERLLIQKFRDWQNPRTEITVRAIQ